MSAVTFEMIEAKVREIASDRPEFNYLEFRKRQLGFFSYDPPSVSCVYWDDDMESSCIFGEAFEAVGMKPTLAYEDLSATLVMKKAFGIELTRSQKAWVKGVQNAQDMGKTWRGAIDYGDQAFRYAQRAETVISS